MLAAERLCDRFRLMVWPTFAPIWKLTLPAEPSSTFLPLYVVCDARRFTSATCCATSCCSAAWLLADSEPPAAWLASERIVCRLAVIWLRPVLAVCTIDVPSFAFETPWFRPLIAVCSVVEMARPAASSAALLMRLPDDRRVIACESALPELFRFS